MDPVYSYTHISVYRCICTCMSVYVNVCVCIHFYLILHTYTYIYIHIGMYIYTYMLGPFESTRRNSASSVTPSALNNRGGYLECFYKSGVIFCGTPFNESPTTWGRNQGPQFWDPQSLETAMYQHPPTTL